MAVVIESEIWQPNYAHIFIALVTAVFYLPALTTTFFYLPSSSSSGNVLDHAPPASFHRFQRSFLFLFSLTSVMEGLWTVFGEYELDYYGLSKDQMLELLCVGYAASIFIGSFLGVLSDLVGHKKLCLLYYILHFLLSILKRFFGNPTIWLGSICLSLASSIFSFSFESWMVVEHGKHGQRQDLLNDMFWLMTFFQSVFFIGSQMVVNYLVDGNLNRNIASVWNEALVLAVVAIVYTTRGWKDDHQVAAIKEYRVSFSRHVINDKRVMLLSCAQAITHFSISAFWILWAPTIVADGREVSLGLIYPCLLGAKMLGCTIFPWLIQGPLTIRTEEYLVYAFILTGLALSVVAFDYQEIGVLVTLFCIFHACMGVISPSLARLRTMYVPNEVRGGMMSLSVMTANAAITFLLILRGYFGYIGNSTILAIAALGLFSGAGCMYMLRRWGKQSRYNL